MSAGGLPAKQNGGLPMGRTAVFVRAAGAASVSEGADLDERVRKRAGVFGRAGERNVGKESESLNLLVEGFVRLVRAGGLVDHNNTAIGSVVHIQG